MKDFILMCIGNRDGGDDAVGPYIADHLKKSDIEVIDCGIVPENYTGVIKQKKPKILIIVDAIDMGLKPGEIRIIPKEKIGVMHISTHGIPIPVLIKYLERHVKNITFVGIQSKKMSGEMTDTVRNSADNLLEKIRNKDLGSITKLV